MTTSITAEAAASWPATTRRYETVLWVLGSAWALSWLALIMPALLIMRVVYESMPAGLEPPLWVIAPHDVSTWLVSAPLLAIGLAGLTLTARMLLARWPGGALVPTWPLAAVLAAATALAIDVPPASDDGWGWSILMWLVAALLVRWLPSKPGRPLRRPRLRVVVAAAAFTVVLLAVPIAYLVLHPLSASAGACYDCPVREGQAIPSSIHVRNDGRHPVEVLAVDLGGIPGPLRLERLGPPPRIGSAGDLVLPMTIPAGRSLHLLAAVRVPRGGCAALATGPMATGVRLRYRVGGQVINGTMPLRPAPTIRRCIGPGIRFADATNRTPEQGGVGSLDGNDHGTG